MSQTLHKLGPVPLRPRLITYVFLGAAFGWPSLVAFAAPPCQSLKWQARWQSLGVKTGSELCPVAVSCAEEVPHLLFLWLTQNQHRSLRIMNIGGEGEFGIRGQKVENINLKHVVEMDSFRTSRGSMSWAELVKSSDRQHQSFTVVEDIAHLKGEANSVDLIFTDSVPLDQNTMLGSGPRSKNILKLLSPKGLWIHNGSVFRKGEDGKAVAISRTLSE